MNFTLCPWNYDDIDSLVENANNINIAKYMTNSFPHPYAAENAKAFIDMATKDTPIHIFAIDVNGKAIGGIGIHPQTDIHEKNAEIGYWIGEAYWGNQIISRAIPQIIEIAFSQYPITRLFAKAFGNNPASQKVLVKSGFALEAHFEKVLFKNGEYLDEFVYGLRR